MNIGGYESGDGRSGTYGADELLILKNDIKHIKESIDEIKGRLKALEESDRNSCRQCGVFAQIDGVKSNITTIEKNIERMKGMAAGVSALIGFIFTVLNFIFSHSGK